MADAYIVSAKVNSQLGLFLVERLSAGVSTQSYSLQDGSRGATLTLKNAPAALITTDGQRALEHAVDVGIAATCAEAVGVMDRIDRDRLYWKCRRGLLELDLVLQRLLLQIEDKDVKGLKQILEFPDNDLWDIVIGRSDAYAPHLNDIVARLRAA